MNGKIVLAEGLKNEYENKYINLEKLYSQLEKRNESNDGQYETLVRQIHEY